MIARPPRVAFCLGLVLAGALAFAPRTATAQDVFSLQGTFAWDSSTGDNIAEAIEAAIADLNFMHRKFARSHLQQENQPYRTVTIEQNEEAISVATDGGKPITAPASGQTIEWTGDDGERMRVSIAREDGAIRQTLITEDGERENLFRPSADGRSMTLEITVQMDRLPEPIYYELAYRQVSPRNRTPPESITPPEGGRTPQGDHSPSEEVHTPSGDRPKQISLGGEKIVVVPTGDWADVGGIGIGFLKRLDFMLSPQFAATLSPGIIFHLSKSQDVGGTSIDRRTTQKLLTAGGRFFVTPRLDVHGLTGLNVRTIKVSDGGQSESESETRIPLILGAGYNVISGLSVGANLLAPNLLLTAAGEDIQTGFMFNVSYTFGLGGHARPEGGH